MSATVSELPRLTNNDNNNVGEMIPLLINNSAPIAKAEIDDELDDNVNNKNDTQKEENKESMLNPSDPRLFSSDTMNINEPKMPNLHEIEAGKIDTQIPEIEITPMHPLGDDEFPMILGNRMGGDDLDTFDGAGNGHTLSIPQTHHNDLEGGSVYGEGTDFNIYQHRKTLAQGMMDLALFSANANQLRYVLESSMHPYYYPSIVLITFSLLAQVAVGIGLIWNATYNVKDKEHLHKANRVNNFTVIGIFLVTVVNVFISAFGVAPGTPAPAVAVVAPVVATGQ